MQRGLVLSSVTGTFKRLHALEPEQNYGKELTAQTFEQYFLSCWRIHIQHLPFTCKAKN